MKDFHNNSIKLAEFIKIRRQSLNLTQEELSEKSGIDYKHIQNMESFKKINDPKYSTLCKLAEALEVDVIEIIIYMNSKQYKQENINRINMLIAENSKNK